MIKYLRTYFFITINSICKLFLEIFIIDRQIRRILKGKLAKLYLKKYVKKALTINLTKEKTKEDNIPTIWQYWEQGTDSMPDIVKICVNSVEKYKENFRHIILDKKTVKNYIDIPDYIWKLNQKGIIKSAHLADIIRTSLLAKYGGVWVDSTILFTDKLPEYITKSELFLFQNDLKTDLDGLNIANYFIASKPNNEMILRMKYILENYWKENLFVWNYFFYLHSFTLLSQINNHYKTMFKEIPYFNFTNVQRFQKELLENYTIERWEQIKQISSIHKLSYKTKVINKKNKDINGTFLEKLLQGELV